MFLSPGFDDSHRFSMAAPLAQKVDATKRHLQALELSPGSFGLSYGRLDLIQLKDSPARPRRTYCLVVD